MIIIKSPEGESGTMCRDMQIHKKQSPVPKLINLKLNRLMIVGIIALKLKLISII